ncbi:phosphotransferase [bacterium]|nr:phosphotransferase [bacterium]
MGALDNKTLGFAKKRWGITDELQFVRRVANYIYYAPGSKIYLRLTEPWHRSVEQVNSELDWMFYLKSKGIELAQPIKSKNGQYCEVIENNHEPYIVSVFEEARGRKILEKEDFTEMVLSNWGELLGKMHKVTKDYMPSGIKKRSEWDQGEYHKNILTLASPEHGKIYDEFKRLEQDFSQLPKDKDSYGLIHADLHAGNFHIDKNHQIIPFDFDDAIYSWFMYDIVVFLSALERFDLDWTFVKGSIFEGYSKHNPISEFWIKQAPDFYRYRLILLHYYFMRCSADPKRDQASVELMLLQAKEYRDFFDLEKSCPF